MKASRNSNQDRIQCERNIVRAFQFLGDVTQQVEALRNSLKAHLKQWEERGSCVLGKIKEDWTMEESAWLCRSVIDTFEIFRKPKRNAKSPIIWGAFQISVAPHPSSADDEFFPHVAVLLAGNVTDWEQWICEEFLLDEEYLSDASEQDDDPWKKEGEVRWVSAKGTPAVAFVVPLVLLTNDADVEKLVMAPFAREVSALLKHMLKI